MTKTLCAILCVAGFASPLLAQDPLRPLPVSMRTVDLNIGDSADVVLGDGKKITVRLIDLKETRDSLRDAVRLAEVTADVNGHKISLVSANYHLPKTSAGVQIDCPV